jgi:hypothetical protein
MIGWSAYTYLDKRNAIGVTESGIEAEVPLYRADTVADALDIFANRQEVFAQLEQSGAPAAPVPAESQEPDVSTTTSTSTDEQSEELDAPAESVEPESPNQAPNSTPTELATSTEPTLQERETPVLMN